MPTPHDNRHIEGAKIRTQPGTKNKTEPVLNPVWDAEFKNHYEKPKKVCDLGKLKLGTVLPMLDVMPSTRRLRVEVPRPPAPRASHTSCFRAGFTLYMVTIIEIYSVKPVCGARSGLGRMRQIDIVYL